MTSDGKACATETALCLSGLEPFAVGGRRLCFVHPLEPSKCVKILRQDERRTVRSRPSLIPARLRREYDNNTHEHQELTRLFRRIGPEASQHLPRSYGMVATDRGPGLVLDLIRDADGGISRSLRELISTGTAPELLRIALEELGVFLMQHAVLTRALLDHNIAAQQRRHGQWRCHLIDGLGDPAWLPVGQLIPFVARSKIRRRLDRLRLSLERLAESPVTPEMIRQSTWDEGFLRHRG